MSNVIVKSDRYTVDPLYQWDLNQDLVIYGLSLASIPEIHFTNSSMDRAIVRQAQMDDAGVITVGVPNSLLQKPYIIKAYVCIYEGETFKSLYCIDISVKGRTKPSDYILEDDPEVYSFNALENLVNNTCKTLTLKCDNTIETVNEGYNKAIIDLNEKCDNTIETVNEIADNAKNSLNDKCIEAINTVNQTSADAIETISNKCEENLESIANTENRVSEVVQTVSEFETRVSNLETQCENLSKFKGDTLYYDVDKFELQLKNGDNILSSVTIPGGLKIVTWADGTYDEIKAMINAHYAGLINISDYWSVGDVRTIPISAISATGVGETQSAQNAQVVIIGFNHDNLVNPINGNSKSAVSLQLKNSLATTGYMYSAYNSPSYSLWDGSPRRTWCNGVFKNALPAELVNLIKTVTKKTYRYAYTGYKSYRTQQTTNDDCFLISEFEVFGVQGFPTTDYGTVGDDGTQYEYYKTTSNRIKYLGVSGTSAKYWWLRSSYVNFSGDSYFRFVNASGSVGDGVTINTFGVAPGFCV